MKSKELSIFLDKLFPHSQGMDDDYLGLQVDCSNDVKKIALMLDVTLINLKKSIQNNVDLIISHHPLFFGEISELILIDKDIKLKHNLLNENKISYYSLHTNYDFDIKGLSYHQAEILGLKGHQVIGDNNDGSYGSLKIKKEQLIKKIKIKFNVDNINAYFHKNSFNKIGIASGASGYLLNQSINKKIELLIVGEAKWHEWVFAKENNISLIEIGHYTESIFSDSIKKILHSKVKEVIIFDQDKIYKSY